MKKIILLLLSLCCICSVFAQTDSLLKKYRNMALEYNHDLKAAEKNIRASIELEKNARADQLPKIGANAALNCRERRIFSIPVIRPSYRCPCLRQAKQSLFRATTCNTELQFP